MASMSRWLVGSSRTRQLTPVAMSAPSWARLRSPGDSSWPARTEMVGTQAELGQQGPGLAQGQVGDGLEGRQHGLGAPEPDAGLVHLPDLDARPDPATPRRQRDLAQQGSQQGGLARPVGPEDRHPVLPAHLQVDRTEAEAGLGRPSRGGPARPQPGRGGPPRRRCGRRRPGSARAATPPRACPPSPAGPGDARWPSPCRPASRCARGGRPAGSCRARPRSWPA